MKTDPYQPSTERHGFRPIGDGDRMPFGKYQGTPMQDVPATYLRWLWNNSKQADQSCPVADYIRRNPNRIKV